MGQRNDIMPALETYIDDLEVEKIGQERIEKLMVLKQWLAEGTGPPLLFVCTHNSRRSQLAQVWAQVFSTLYGKGVQSYSAGTEVTACHPNIVSTLQRAGFIVTVDREMKENATVEAVFCEKASPVVLYSKAVGDSSLPTKDLIALMTCSEADLACPLILGASKRIGLTYADPKISDGTDQEASTYDARCRQIATEMKWVFST